MSVLRDTSLENLKMALQLEETRERIARLQDDHKRLVSES